MAVRTGSIKMYDIVYFRDRRLKGTNDLFRHINTFHLDKNILINSAFTFAKSRKKILRKKLRTLCIDCHGYSESISLFQHKRLSTGVFSGVIELGKENLMVSNVAHWHTINNLFKYIVVYACYAGQTPFGKKGTKSDGKTLMKLLAKYTNATVYAADAAQTYDPDGMKMHSWTGTVYQFSPNGAIKIMPGFLVRGLTGV